MLKLSKHGENMRREHKRVFKASFWWRAPLGNLCARLESGGTYWWDKPSIQCLARKYPRIFADLLLRTYIQATFEGYRASTTCNVVNHTLTLFDLAGDVSLCEHKHNQSDIGIKPVSYLM